METGFRKWIITITVIISAIIELIDTTIVNVSINTMSGNLAASLEDTAWVITSYAIANVIVIPMTSFLAEKIGRKQYYIGSIILFTVTSAMCGLSSSLWELVAFRFLQGLGGGALLSTSQAILFETFPPKDRAMASGIFALGVIIGPSIGPVMGGYIVDNASWPWIFFVNVPIGILATILCVRYLRPSKPSRDGKPIDWAGIGLLAVGVGALQVVLERGETDDWFAANYIVVLTVLSVLALTFFVWWQLRAPFPVVNLRVLRSVTLSISAFMTFVLGFGLFPRNNRPRVPPGLRQGRLPPQDIRLITQDHLQHRPQILADQSSQEMLHRRSRVRLQDAPQHRLIRLISNNVRITAGHMGSN